jgi:tetratricopeptide (TPR) repeat protein
MTSHNPYLGIGDLAHLVQERYERAGAASHDLLDTKSVVSLLVAAGSGPVLPIDLLEAALRVGGHNLSTSSIRDIVVELGTLVSRGNPGQIAERVGIAHAAFLSPLTSAVGLDEVQAAHHHIASALEDPALVAHADAATYFAQSLPRHLLASGDPESAFAFLESADAGSTIDNELRWSGWLPSFDDVLEPDDPLLQRVRERASDWRHTDRLAPRSLKEYETLVSERAATLGGTHPDTLATRSLFAAAVDRAGDRPRAIGELRRLLLDRARLLGETNSETIATRSNLARLLAEAAEFAEACEEMQHVIDVRRDILGENHPDTLSAINTLASFYGQSGDARSATTYYQQAYLRRREALGPFNAETLNSLASLSQSSGEMGDYARAIKHTEDLLNLRVHLLGPDHPDALAARLSMANWKAQSGDIDGAIRDLGDLLSQRIRVLGPDHLDTLATRATRAEFIAEVGNYTAAIAELEILLGQEVALLGTEHERAFETRARIVGLLERSGQVKAAIDRLQEEVALRESLFGLSDRRTLSRRGLLAEMRWNAGDLTGGVADLEILLSRTINILGAGDAQTQEIDELLKLRRSQAADNHSTTNENGMLRSSTSRPPSQLCERTGLALVAASGQVLGRIAKTKNQLIDARRRTESKDRFDWGQYDVAGGRTFYGATPPAAAYAEALAWARTPPRLSLAELFDDASDSNSLIDAISDDMTARGFMAPGTIPAAWRRDRLYIEYSLPDSGWLVDIGDAASLAALARAVKRGVDIVGTKHAAALDFVGTDRSVTTRIATWISQQTLFDGSNPLGLMYPSRFNRDWTCFAIWLDSVRNQNGAEIRLLASHEIVVYDANDDLGIAATLLGVTVY